MTNTERTERTERMKDRKFGIEIEVERISRSGAAGAVARALTAAGIADVSEGGERVYSALGTWNVVHDGSLNSGCEVVSPPMTYRDSINALQEVVRELRRAGAKVESSCGVHVHVSTEGLDARNVANLAKMIFSKQQVIRRALNVSDRRWGHYTAPLEQDWVRSISRARSMDSLKRAWYRTSSIQRANSHAGSRYDSSRYHGLNLHSVFYRGTAEFRFFNGTLHAGQIRAYVAFCLAAVQTAKETRGFQIRECQASDQRHEFRTFLWRNLALVGEEFAAVREHLTKNLPTRARVAA